MQKLYTLGFSLLLLIIVGITLFVTGQRTSSSVEKEVAQFESRIREEVQSWSGSKNQSNLHTGFYFNANDTSIDDSTFPLDLPKPLLSQLIHSNYVKWVYPEGIFLFIKKEAKASTSVLTLYLQKNNSISTELNSVPLIPSHFELTLSKEDYPILIKDEQAIFYIKQLDKHPQLSSSLATFLFVSVIVIIVFLQLIIKSFQHPILTEGTKNVFAFIMVIVLLFSFKALDYGSVILANPMLATLWESTFPWLTLGEYFFVAWAVLSSQFIFDVNATNSRFSILNNSIIFSIINIYLWIIAWCIEYLLFSDQFQFSIISVLNLNIPAITSLVIIIFLFLGLLFWGQKKLHHLGKEKPDKRIRNIGMGIGVLVGTIAGMLLKIEIFPAVIILVSILHVALWNIYSDLSSNSLTWTFIWLVGYASFGSGIAFTYQTNEYLRKASTQIAQIISEEVTTTSQQLYSWKMPSFITPQNTDYLRKQSTHLSQLISSENQNLLFPNWLIIKRDGQIVEGKGSVPQQAVNVLLDRKQDRSFVLNGKFLAVGQKLDNQRLIILNRPMQGYAEPITIFSALFISMMVGVLTRNLFIVTQLTDIYDVEWFSDLSSLSTRLQNSVFAILLGSFILVGLISISFIKRNATFERQKQTIANLNALSESLSKITNGDLLQQLSITSAIDSTLLLYDTKGKLIWKADQTKELFSFQVSQLPENLIREVPAYNYYQGQSPISQLQLFYLPIKNSQKETKYIASIIQKTIVASDGIQIGQFLGNLLNVYVFLLIIAGTAAIFLTNSITRPIAQIGNHLSATSLEENSLIPWDRKDEIGQLVDSYNSMITKLAEQTELLKKNEREEAWQEMAKQVAHEIKNPLTPMKLNVQYLLRAYDADPQNIDQMLKRVSNTLIEQINSLSRIATEFSNFAKMPSLKVERFSIQEMLLGITNLYKDQSESQLEILLSAPEEHLFVKADREQLSRVCSNLIKNGIQAIPEDRKGGIHVKAQKQHEKVIITVTDNGTGIPEHMKAKVFVPNFTTKSSGSGLGLAISKNIIESVNGEIYFDTEEGKGTTFTIKLPLDNDRVVEDD
ncbi:MAG: ATP-binding protein [Bacteroidota bacterium]